MAVQFACAVAPRNALRGGRALSLQLMGTAVTRRRLPDPTHPARAPAFVVGTGDEYAGSFEGGDKFLRGCEAVGALCGRGAVDRCAGGAWQVAARAGRLPRTPAGEVSPGPSFLGEGAVNSRSCRRQMRRRPTRLRGHPCPLVGLLGRVPTC